MNQVVSAARSLGVMIIHAPSDTMKFYEGTPWRERMQQAPAAASPFPILDRCPRDPDEERNFPIDDSAGGCDDPVVKNGDGPPSRGRASIRPSTSSALTASATTARRSTTSASRKASTRSS